MGDRAVKLSVGHEHKEGWDWEQKGEMVHVFNVSVFYCSSSIA